MTRRERTLALCLGLAAAGVGLATMVRYAVVTPFDQLRKDITHEQERGASVRKRLGELANIEQSWQALTRRTLSADPREAQARFREDMHKLLTDYGLGAPKISPGERIKEKTGLITAPLTITATGTLDKIVQFLCEFYSRDYIARLEKVDVIADAGVLTSSAGTKVGAARAAKGGARTSSSGPNGPELKLSLTAVTLVLPKITGVPHPVLEKPAPSEAAQRLSHARADYRLIHEKNLFRPWEPPQVAKVTPTPPTTQNDNPPPPPPPPPDPRPDADKFYVRMTSQEHGEPIAWIADTRPDGEGLVEYSLDEPLDDGVLVLIHPEGLVVRVEPKAGAVETDYFYPLGSSFAEREELSADKYPEVASALEWLEDEFD